MAIINLPENLRKRPDIINIGYAGESYARDIEIDISDLLSMWPGSRPVIVHQRAGETEGWLVDHCVQEGSILTWSFSAYDMEKVGQGEAQVMMLPADYHDMTMDEIVEMVKSGLVRFIGKSERIKTHCLRSVPLGQNPPEHIAPYVQRILVIGTLLGDALNLWQNMRVVTHDLPHGSESEADYHEGVLDLGIPEGPAGKAPAMRVETIEGGHKVVFEDQDGTVTSVDVLDGRNGSDASVTKENINAAVGLDVADGIENAEKCITYKTIDDVNALWAMFGV